MTAPLIEVENLSRRFDSKRGLIAWRGRSVRAVDGVSFTIGRGEVVGLVGESGSGKSTIGRTLLRLIEPSGGTVRFDGRDLAMLTSAELSALRKRMQIVFQDPYGSLDPRKPVADVIGNTLDMHGLARGAERGDHIKALLQDVGLGAEHLDRYPHEFSGGQRQRISIARALATAPDFLVADEPVSALDVSVQAQIVNLLADLRRKRGLTMLFISHDLSVVEYLSDRVIVLYLGRIVEMAPTRDIYARPRHPYTQALLSATPVPDPDAPPRRIVLTGEMPSAANPPPGCAFHTRCPFALDRCRQMPPPLEETTPGHVTACWRKDEILNPSADT